MTSLLLEQVCALPPSRPRLQLAVAVDRSAHMSPDGLEAAAQVVRALVAGLGEDDHISLVAFGDQAMTLAHPGTAGGRRAVWQALERLTPAGKANLSVGWLQAWSLVDESEGAKAVRRVVVLGTGRADLGIREAPTLAQVAGYARSRGVITSAIRVAGREGGAPAVDGSRSTPPREENGEGVLDLLEALAGSAGGGVFNAPALLEALRQAGQAGDAPPEDSLPQAG